MIPSKTLPLIRNDTRYKWRAQTGDAAAEKSIRISQSRLLLTCAHDGLAYRELKRFYDDLSEWINLNLKDKTSIK